MAPSPFSLFLRLLSTPYTAPHHRHHHHRLLRSPFVKHFSASSTPNPSDPPKTPSLSSRLSFVFDQIDQIEKERSEKDGALQRIRAWRESRKPKHSDTDASTHRNDLEAQELGFVATAPAGNDGPPEACVKLEGQVLAKNEVELTHPWPEWIEFMERLVKQNYFDHLRKNEDRMITGLGFDPADAEEVSPDFVRDWKTVHAAVLNFGKDRFDIFRSFARHDIQMLVGYGCPNSDRKAVFSSKLLRKYVHLDEGDVCSSCSLRTSCDKAYLLTNKEDEARTIDIVRVLMTYAFEPINGAVANKSLLKKKSTKSVVRKLLHEVVKLSSVPIDPNLPPPIIKKRPPKVKQPPPPPRRRIGRDDIEMKKGDWLCPKCDFMNFAKNSICLQCDAKRPKRQLLPGEWECPQCNFLNYRRNMACFHCEHKRPADEFTENEIHDRRRGPSTRSEPVVDRKEVYNAWNFDFDDDESDGADVAAFEHADSRGSHDNHRSDVNPERAQYRDDSYPNDRNPRSQNMSPQPKGTGFDDFEDEEDDDNIENYEIEDTNTRGQREETSSVNLSDIEGSYSMSEDEEENELVKNGRPSSRWRNKSALKGSDDDIGFGSEDDLPVHPKWKSSHVADCRQQRGKAPRRRGFDSDEEDDDDLPSGSDDDDNDRSLRSKTGRENTRVSGRRETREYGEFDRERRGGGRGGFGGQQRQLRQGRDGRGSFGGKQRQARDSFDSGSSRRGRGGFGKFRESGNDGHFEEDSPKKPPRVNVR